MVLVVVFVVGVVVVDVEEESGDVWIWRRSGRMGVIRPRFRACPLLIFLSSSILLARAVPVAVVFISIEHIAQARISVADASLDSDGDTRAVSTWG